MPFPPEKGKKYVVSGMPRSGSTVVWQIANALLPGLVMRSHCYIHTRADEFEEGGELEFGLGKDVNEIPTIVTVRDPFDAFISHERVKGRGDEKYIEVVSPTGLPHLQNIEQRKRLEHFIRTYIFDTVSYFLSGTKGGRNVFFIPYEGVIDEDLIFRVTGIAQFMDIEISSGRAREIADMFSIERNKKIADTYENFDYYCKETFIHGDHIGPTMGQPGGGNLIPPNVRALLADMHSAYFFLFDYHSHFSDEFKETILPIVKLNNIEIFSLDPSFEV